MKEIISTRDASNQQETRVAKLLGGVKTANSGATSFTKGDVIVGNILVECKTKMKESSSFTVQEKWITTLEEERRGMGKTASAIAISFDVGKSNYFIIGEREMKMLVDLINSEE